MSVACQAVGKAHDIERQDDVAEIKQYGFYHGIVWVSAQLQASRHITKRPKIRQTARLRGFFGSGGAEDSSVEAGFHGGFPQKIDEVGYDVADGDFNGANFNVG